MSTSALPTPQIPLDHNHKQLLFQPSCPSSTVSWSPPLPGITSNLLAVGHSQGVSVYRQPDDTEATHTLDRAEAFRKRYAFVYGWSLIVGGLLNMFVMLLLVLPSRKSPGLRYRLFLLLQIPL
jgi:hypothetical protein